ncbi:hypothetical protein McanMca71_005778 [Microsporum canis]|uniref:Uncharacterized protein n=1 Tax=Arthroderma otae (strain ATCC MYA-4605 / CBS 113480) TaxID=554155 RepID=C5FC07_ARTOC|nr:uncharacterized protein MCYG_00229 [Microsporum canis CBS 113480]EEQ27341.1 predicted protein [Microsporum canis CBS 113480]
MLSQPTKRSREEKEADEASETELTLRKKRIKPLCLRPLAQQAQPHGFTALPLTPTAAEEHLSESDLSEESGKLASNGGDKLHFPALLSPDNQVYTETDADMEMTDCLSTASSSNPAWPACFPHTECRDVNLHSLDLSRAIINKLDSTEVDQCSAPSIHPHSLANTMVSQTHIDAPSVAPVDKFSTPQPDAIYPSDCRLPSPISEYQDESKSHTGTSAVTTPQFGHHVEDPSINPDIIRCNPTSLESINMQATHPASYFSITRREDGTLADGPENTITPVSPLATKSPKKAIIAMGFRADCDRCQRREPGHYSHIVYA